MVGGDFNMITSAADKNNNILNHRIMSRFRCFIADMELHDIYLAGNNRVLCTPSWKRPSSPACFTASPRHRPTIARCSLIVLQDRRRKRFHFEQFWAMMEGYLDVVSQAWHSVDPDPTPSVGSMNVSRSPCTSFAAGA